VVEQQLPFPFEIIVVDNNSRERKEEDLREDFPDIVLIESDQNEGFAKAVNRGIAQSRGKYILLLNPDIVVLKDSISRMLDHMRTHTDIAALGPKIISPNGEIQESCRKFISPRIILYRRTWLARFEFARKATTDNLMLGWDHNTERDVHWIQGSSMLVRRTAIDEVGMMDERFFMYMEDMDWCRRFWDNGWRVVYYPEAEMVHYYQRMSGQQTGVQAIVSNKLTRIHLKSGVKYFWKHILRRPTITRDYSSLPSNIPLISR
jgi:N-acetylglucosaminyl-diphospho-decaprenol L-rhamnosyltransferase